MRIYSCLEVRAGAGAPGLTSVLNWLSHYLTAPHPDLGRSGAVCPYVRPALTAGSIYLTEARLSGAGDDDVDRSLTAMRQRWSCAFRTSRYATRGAFSEGCSSALAGLRCATASCSARSIPATACPARTTRRSGRCAARCAWWRSVG